MRTRLGRHVTGSCWSRVVPLVRDGEMDNEPAKYLNRFVLRHM